MTFNPKPYIDKLLINTSKARHLIDNNDDPIINAILEASLGTVLARFIVKDSNETLEDYEANLPDEPFDAHFYLQLIVTLFRDKEAMARLMKGDLNALDPFYVPDDK